MPAPDQWWLSNLPRDARVLGESVQLGDQHPPAIATRTELRGRYGWVVARLTGGGSTVRSFTLFDDEVADLTALNEGRAR